MRWYYDRNTAELDKKRDVEPRFVYFRSPFSVTCTKFEDTALHDPEVIKQTADMLCIMLSYDFDKQIAATWGVKSAPGIAIVAPDDTLLAARSGEITTDDVLKALQTARDALQRAQERKKPAGPAASRPLVAP